MNPERLPMRRIRAAIARCLREFERGKKAYQASDAALKAAIQLGLPLDVPVTLDGGKVMALRDPFAEKDTVWRPARCPRYLLEEVKPLPTRPKAKPEGGAA